MPTNCENCGKEIRRGTIRRDKIRVPNIGPLKDKPVCATCYKSLQPKLDRIRLKQAPRVGSLDVFTPVLLLIAIPVALVCIGFVNPNVPILVWATGLALVACMAAYVHFNSAKFKLENDDWDATAVVAPIGLLLHSYRLNKLRIMQSMATGLDAETKKPQRRITPVVELARGPAYPPAPPPSVQPAPPTPTEKPKPSLLYCVHCGTENPPTNEYCGKCGQKLLRAS